MREIKFEVDMCIKNDIKNLNEFDKIKLLKEITPLDYQKIKKIILMMEDNNEPFSFRRVQEIYINNCEFFNVRYSDLLLVLDMYRKTNNL